MKNCQGEKIPSPILCMTGVGIVAQFGQCLLEGGVTNGHFDVVVIELVAFLEGRKICRSAFGACMTKGSFFAELGAVELSGHIGHASPIYMGAGGNSEGCNMGGEMGGNWINEFQWKSRSRLGTGMRYE
jgi:hypothetical protein